MAAESISSSVSTRLGPAATESDAAKLWLIDEITSNAEQVQAKVLDEILTRNAQTEYLQRFQLGGATDREVFKAKVPVVTHEDLQQVIHRIANGDQSPILTVDTISEFLASSGTSDGERKLIPFTDEELQRRLLFSGLFMPIMNIYVPGLDKGKALHFLFVKSESKTPGGLPARSALTSFFKSNYFQARPYDPYSVYTSPNEAILCPDPFQSMYAQMVCGLCMRQEVLRIGGAFASGLLRAIRFLQLHWKELEADLASGTLSDKVTDRSVREAVQAVLTKPEPELALSIEKECSKGEWEGIITRIWPMTKYLDVIITGAMAQYIDTLNYYSGGLPLVCIAYAASECYIGINLHPMCNPTEVSFTIMPNMAYFEFLPVEQGDVNNGNPSVLRLAELTDVEVGKEYEIVVTTYSGLYRYRVGDILRVTGFHNAAPQFHFVRRKNVLLTIESDKTDEAELQKAVHRASDILKDYATSIVEYSSHADTKTIPGHYVIYFELLTKDPSFRQVLQVMERCCLAMENTLSAVYRQSRVETGAIGPLEIRVVRPGTFEELMDYAISRGSSINQYKVPRCVNVPAIVELLDNRVVSTHFSQEAPFWP